MTTPDRLHPPLDEHDKQAIGRNMVGALQEALEAERSKIANDRLAIAEERLSLRDAIAEANARTGAPKQSWFAEWLKPGAILPITAFAIAAFVTYEHDQASITKSVSDLAGNVATISTKLDHDEQATADRVKDLVPLIRSADMAQKQNDIINKEEGDRIEALAQSVIQLRQSMEALRDAVTKTHEEMMIDRARREGRLVPGRGIHSDPDETATTIK